MRIAILCDGTTLSQWQCAAVAQIASTHDIVLLVAHGGPVPRRHIRHAAYYALNLVSVRNRQTRRVPFPSAVDRFERFDFAAGQDGGWATLPDAAIDWLKDQRVDVVIKFALNLLRIPPAEKLAIPILSYHHGDPSAFRGRPAGSTRCAVAPTLSARWCRSFRTGLIREKCSLSPKRASFPKAIARRSAKPTSFHLTS